MSLAFQPRRQYKQSPGHLGNQEAQLGAEAGQDSVLGSKGKPQKGLGGCTVSMFVFLFVCLFFKIPADCMWKTGVECS